MTRLSLVAGLILALLGTSALAQEPAPGPGQGVLDPNPFRFAKDPTRLDRWTPLELWDAVDYLLRINEGPRAVPFLDEFLRRPLDDRTLLAIRDRYGRASVLRLQDSPATRARARPLLNALAEAGRRDTTNPERLRRYVAALAATPEEQDYAVERLREAGPAAVPVILRTLADKDLTEAAWALTVANLGRLDRTAVPPLLAALDAPDPALAAAAAEALGRIGDTRAVPYLVYPATAPEAAPAVRDAARRALRRLTGRPLPEQPARALVQEARRYLDRRVEFPDGPFEIWTWQGDAPAPRRATRDQAEALLGLRFASQAQRLDPKDPAARAAVAGLSLRRAAVEAQPAQVPLAPPEVLIEALRAAIARGDSAVGSAAARALGQAANADDGRLAALADALAAPDRRIRFAAAQALVELGPRDAFPGSSQVVPVLSQFAGGGTVPKVVVVDGNPARANHVGSVLKSLGYDALAVGTGEQGFRLAAESGDVEAVAVEPSGLGGAWNTLDLLTNLRADARTAALPVFLLQPADLQRAQARTEQLAVRRAEQEPNDSTDLANPLAFTSPPRRAAITGGLRPDDPIADVFAIGRLGEGDAIDARVTMPSYSTLKPSDVVLTILGPEGVEPAGNAGAVTYTTTVEGEYFVQLRVAPARRGNLALYDLEVGLLERTPPPIGTAIRQRLEALAARFPKVAVLTAPHDAGVLRRQWSRAFDAMGVHPLTDAEREAFSRQAADLLARIAAAPGGPFGDVTEAVPALGRHVAALRATPSVEAQRTLADALLDPAAAPRDRVAAAEGLLRSLDRFGRLLSAAQERRLIEARDAATDEGLRKALESVLDALRPSPSRAVPTRSSDPLK